MNGEILHEVLLSFGHTMVRDRHGAACWTANPTRCDKWGSIPEADWQAAEMAAMAPAYGPRRPSPVYAMGRYISTREHYTATGEDLPCGYHERTIIGRE